MQKSILHIPHHETPYPAEPWECIPLMGVAIEIKSRPLPWYTMVKQEETMGDHIVTVGLCFMFMRRKEGFVICLN